MERAATAVATLSPREKRHVEALALWVAGRGNDAIPVMLEHLAEHPSDALLMQRLYFIYFWQARSPEMPAPTKAPLPALPADGRPRAYHALPPACPRRTAEARPPPHPAAVL